MIISEADQRFYIGESTLSGAGKGLFAKVPLARGETLEVLGALIPRNSISDQCTRYADPYKFRVGGHLLLPFGYGGLVNHSADPNMEKVIKGKRVYLRVLRPIKREEELFFRYSKYALASFGLPSRGRSGNSGDGRRHCENRGREKTGYDSCHCG